MRYRELLEQYKNGQLSLEEREEVEQDIEKQDAISEYLTERLEAEMEELDGGAGEAERDKKGNLTFAADSDSGADSAASGEKVMQEAARFEAYVKKSIRRSFCRMGAVVCGIALAVVLFVQFGLSPLVAHFYYDPTEIIRVEDPDGDEPDNYWSTSRMSRDFFVYSELLYPGERRDTVNAVSQGYGNYAVTISNSYYYGDRRTQDIGGTVRKGKLTLYDPNYLKGQSVNLFACYQLDGTSSLTYEEQREELNEQEGGEVLTWSYSSLEEGKEALEELSDGKLYQAYVTLEKNTSFADMVTLLQELTERELVSGDIWLGVICDGRLGGSQMGYYYSSIQNGLVLTEEEKERYPYLSLYEELYNTDHEQAEANLDDEAAMTSHFDSMLKYLLDQEDFLAMMDNARGQSGGNLESDLKDARAYVQENGLKFYGFVCIADKEQMLEIFDTSGILAVAKADE